MTVSIAPVGTDPLTAAGWTDVGWLDEDGLQFAGDVGDEFSCPGLRSWTAKVEFPKVSRETIMLAMGQDPSEIPAHVPRDWRDRTVSDIMRDIIGVPVVESPWVPPDMAFIGAPALPWDSPWFDAPDDDPWERNAYTFRAAERLAMQVARPRYDLSITVSPPTIGYPPKKGRGLTGRRYRAARRAYARKRRAWVRQGSPTDQLALRVPFTKIVTA